MANAKREANPEARVIRPAAGGRLRLAGAGALCAVDPRDVVGPLVAGGRCFALSKGACGFGDVLRYLLEVSGPARLLVATWSISADEIGSLRRLLDHGSVVDLRLAIDPSFAARHPAYCAKLRASFGAESVRLVACHAKIGVVTNDKWALVLRSSANLNAAHRVEFFEVEDSKPLAEFIAGTFADWFDLPAPDQWDLTPSEHRRRFKAWRAAPAAMAAGHPDDAKYFNDGAHAVDLRRSGLTFAKTGKEVVDG